MHRRTFLRNTSGLLVGSAIATRLPSSAFGAPVRAESTAAPVVDTTAGRVRGVVSTDPGEHAVQAFLGIPYGAPTGGSGRFQPPAVVKPWSGVRDALSFANRAPQAPAGPQRPGPEAKLWRFATEPMSEDCLALNVWTPASDGRKRPVMFCCHGGGFSSGSS